MHQSQLTEPLATMPLQEKTAYPEKRCIKYRKDVCTFDSHATAYTFTTGWEDRRNKNQLKSTIHWMPRELLIEIMLHLKPEELFLFRQTCSLIFQLSLRGAFAENYETAGEKQTPQWKPSGIQRLFRSIFDLQVPRQVPAFKTFRLQDDGRKKLKSLRHRHRLRQGLCQECWKRVDSSTEKQCSHGPEASATRLLFCHYCDAMHNESWFSVNRHQKGRRVCIGWEGSVRICSHHDILWSSLISLQMATMGNTEPVLFKCVECSKSIGWPGTGPRLIKRPYSYQPSPIAVNRSTATATNTTPAFLAKRTTMNTTLEWKLVVCQLQPTQVVTKDLLGQGLKRLQRDHGDLCCPHLRFTDEDVFMLPFNINRCACFRDPAVMDNKCHWHSPSEPQSDYARRFCCACHAKDNPNLIGRFMAHDEWKLHHSIFCGRCSFKYLWRLEENDYVVLLGSWDTTTDFKFAAAHSGLTEESFGWILGIDPSTFTQDEELRHSTWCEDKSCSNSRAKKLHDWKWVNR